MKTLNEIREERNKVAADIKALKAARLEEIKQASAELEQIKAAYNAAVDKFNALIVDGFDRAGKIYR